MNNETHSLAREVTKSIFIFFGFSLLAAFVGFAIFAFDLILFARTSFAESRKAGARQSVNRLTAIMRMELLSFGFCGWTPEKAAPTTTQTLLSSKWSFSKAFIHSCTFLVRAIDALGERLPAVPAVAR